MLRSGSLPIPLPSPHPQGKDKESYFLHNHLRFTILYNRDANTDLSRIVGFEVEPFSVKHEYDKPYNSANPVLNTCNVAKMVAVSHSQPPMEVKEGNEVIFTYDVKFTVGGRAAGGAVRGVRGGGGACGRAVRGTRGLGGPRRRVDGGAPRRRWQLQVVGLATGRCMSNSLVREAGSRCNLW